MISSPSFERGKKKRTKNTIQKETSLQGFYINQMTPFSLVFLVVVLCCIEARVVKLLDGSLVQGSDRNAWLGIPYGLTDGRWTDSRPHPPLLGVFNATSFGCACPQTITPSLEFPEGTCLEEECLTVNVFVPPGRTGSMSQLLPVLFWIHGGAFMLGGSAEIPFHGYNLVQKYSGVIVVTFNYRLGPLGFLAHKDMTASSKGAFGLADQRLALLWTWNNIKSFGGDPSRITVQGESAGGSSVAYMLTYFDSVWPMIHRAIVQSAAPVMEQLTTRQDAEAVGDRIASKCGCASYACLLNLSWTQLDACSQQVVPNTGQQVLIEDSWTGRISSGRILQVPVLWGNTMNEFTFFVYSVFPAVVPPEEFDTAMAKLFQGFGVPGYSIPDSISCNNATDCRPLMGTILSAWGFVCDEAMLGRREKQSFAYIWDHVPSWLNLPPAWGVIHASELKFIFLTLPPNATAQERLLADQITSVWTLFAQGVNPPWETYDNSTCRYVFQTTTAEEEGNNSATSCGWQTDLCKKISASGIGRGLVGVRGVV